MPRQPPRLPARSRTDLPEFSGSPALPLTRILAEAQGLAALRPPEATGVAARAQRRSPKGAPETFRSEYVHRAEQELTERGEYSWTADIRARVRIARTVSRSEAEFRSILGTMGVTVADNSPKTERRDWIYALASHPSRRISGERMGLAYGRERLEPLLRSGGVRRLEDAGERAIAAIAKRAVAVGDLAELRSLSGAVALIESSHARCLDDLDTLLKKDGDEATPQLVRYVKEKGLLPEERPAPTIRKPKARTGSRPAGSRPKSDMAQPAHQNMQERRREGSER